LSPTPKRFRPRGVVDTSVLIAGIAGFKRGVSATNPSAQFLRRWLERANFIWLVSDDILTEYRDVLHRLGVRSHLIGRVLNLLEEAAEHVRVGAWPDATPDPDDAAMWACADVGRADFVVTLNPKDFPQHRLVAKVIGPTDPIPHRQRSRR
jgi:predicted nucleic acid-binding protein